MYTDICCIMIDMLPEHPNLPTFSQLLGKMGIDAGHKCLFDQCIKYKHGEDELVGAWNYKIADLVVEMDFDVILISSLVMSRHVIIIQRQCYLVFLKLDYMGKFDFSS